MMQEHVLGQDVFLVVLYIVLSSQTSCGIRLIFPVRAGLATTLSKFVPLQ